MKKIVYNGYVLNTSARIQAQCNNLDQKLLVPTEQMETIPVGPEYKVIQLEAA